MKYITIITLFILLLGGCREPDPRIIYSSGSWDIVKINDSIVVCVPQLGTDINLTPVIIKTKKYNYETETNNRGQQ